MKELESIATVLKQSGDPIEITGYPKNISQNSKTNKLYEERLAQVYKSLIENGVYQKRIKFVKFGDPTTSPDGYKETCELKISNN